MCSGGNSLHFIGERLRTVMTADEAILLCAGELGMRLSDITQLRWEDIDMQRKIIRYRVAKNGIDATVPMSPALVLYFSQKQPKGTLVFAKPPPRTHKEYHALRLRFLRKRCGY